MWHCPKCGKELAKGKAWARARQQHPGQEEHEMSLNYDCESCGLTLTVHHPIYGYKHPPGDSWSVSFIK